MWSSRGKWVPAPSWDVAMKRLDEIRGQGTRIRGPFGAMDVAAIGKFVVRQRGRQEDRQEPGYFGDRIRGDVEFRVYWCQARDIGGEYPDAHGMEVPAGCGVVDRGGRSVPALQAISQGGGGAGGRGFSRPGRVSERGCWRG